MQPENQPRRPITMRDVAAAAAVAPSTVSRALRNDPQVSTAVRERIRALALKLGYRPNPFVQAFTAQVRGYRSAPNHAVLAVLDCAARDRVTSCQAQYARGFQERSDALGFRTELLSLRDIEGDVSRVAQIVRARGVAGLLALPGPLDTDLTALPFQHLAAATIDYSIRRPDLHRAAPNHFQNMRLALERLREAGYRRIGFCTFRMELDRIGLQWLGAFSAVTALGPAPERVPVHVNPFDPAQPNLGAATKPRAADVLWARSREAFAIWLERTRPDVVLSNDNFFLGWLLELGRKVPGEVGYATLGTNREAAGVSGIDQNREVVGSAAAELVIGQLHRNEYGLPALPKTVLVNGVWRQSATTRSGNP